MKCESISTDVIVFCAEFWYELYIFCLLDVQLSSFHLLNTSLTEEHIQQFAKSCVKSVDGSFINLDDIELRTDARLIMPSQCDGRLYL